jgi:hypothetical protein
MAHVVKTPALQAWGCKFNPSATKREKNKIQQNKNYSNNLKMQEESKEIKSRKQRIKW